MLSLFAYKFDTVKCLTELDLRERVLWKRKAGRTPGALTVRTFTTQNAEINCWCQISMPLLEEARSHWDVNNVRTLSDAPGKYVS